VQAYLLAGMTSATAVAGNRTLQALLANLASVFDMGLAAVALKAAIGATAGLASGLLGIGARCTDCGCRVHAARQQAVAGHVSIAACAQAVPLCSIVYL
jgi:hypothetical protein